MSGLTDMKVAQLKKIAGTSCIKGYSTMKKSNLVVAIRAHKLPIPKVAKVKKAPKAKAPKAPKAKAPVAPSKKDKARSRIRALVPGLATAMAKDVNLGGRPKGSFGPKKSGLAKLGVIF